MMDNSITNKPDGSSAEKAVVINETSSSRGIPAEYAYIEQVFSRRGLDYEIKMQAQISQGGCDYDVLTIEMNDGTVRDFWFDITSFFGKF